MCTTSMTCPSSLNRIGYEREGAELYSTLLECDFGEPSTESRSCLKLVLRLRTCGRLSAGSTNECGMATYPPFVVTNAGETAIERNVRSIEPRATAAHSLETFQPAHVTHNFTITLGLDGPVWRRKVTDVNDSPEPTKIPGRDFRRGRRVKVHAKVRSLRKNFCSFLMEQEHLDLCTNM